MRSNLNANSILGHEIVFRGSTNGTMEVNGLAAVASDILRSQFLASSNHFVQKARNEGHGGPTELNTLSQFL